MKFVPLNNTIHVQPEDLKKSKGGIELPDRMGDEDRPGPPHFTGLGTVVACGPGQLLFNEKDGSFVTAPMIVKPGDRIMFFITGGNEFKPEGIGGPSVFMIKPEQLVAIVEE